VNLLMTFKYFMHGLKIESEFELLATAMDFETPDLNISVGKIPKDIDNPDIVRSKLIASKTECIITVSKIGKYYIVNGNRIVVEPLIGVKESEYRVFLEGRAIAAVLNQKKMLTLHGSGIYKGNKGILILGHSGAGKTSLVTGLLENGYNLLTDDVIAYFIENGKPFLRPGMPVQKISKELVEKYNLNNHIIGRVDYPGVKHDKYHINRLEKYRDSNTEIKTIVYIMPHNGDTNVIELQGMEKVEMLLKNVYMKKFVDLYLGYKEKFKMVNNLASNCSIYLLKREISIDSIDKQIELLQGVI